MSPIWVSPPAVPTASVRRLSGDEREAPRAVQQLQVALVPAAGAVPRQLDAATLRLMTLQLENEHLRAELEQQRG